DGLPGALIGTDVQSHELNSTGAGADALEEIKQAAQRLQVLVVWKQPTAHGHAREPRFRRGFREGFSHTQRGDPAVPRRLPLELCKELPCLGLTRWKLTSDRLCLLGEFVHLLFGIP